MSDQKKPEETPKEKKKKLNLSKKTVKHLGVRSGLRTGEPTDPSGSDDSLVPTNGGSYPTVGCRT